MVPGKACGNSGGGRRPFGFGIQTFVRDDGGYTNVT